MTDAQQPPKSRERQMRRWLLVVSLGFNLLIVGLIAGVMVKGGPPGHAGGRVDLSLGPMTRALSEEDRRAVREGFERNRPFQPGERQAMRADFDALLALLEAESFDAEAFRGVLARQRDRLQTAQDGVVDQFVQHIESMPLADRRAFAERLAGELRSGVRDRDGPRRD